MKKFRACFLWVPLVLMLTGCWNMRELEHSFYANAVGVDYVNDQYVVYIQVLNFSTLSKQEGGGGGEKTGTWVGKGVGKTVESAIHNLYSTSQRRIYWGHLNTLVLSESLLKHGVDEVLDLTTRFNELRLNIWVYATHDSLKEVLLVSPILEESPVYSQLSDPNKVYSQSSFIVPIRLNRFLVALKEPGQTPLMPTLHLNKDQWNDPKRREPAIEIDGVVALKKGKWNGSFAKSQIHGLRWLDRQTKRTPLIVYSQEKPVATLIMKKPKSKVISQINNGAASFKVKVEVPGVILDMTKEVSEVSLSNLAENSIKEEIRRTWNEGNKKDVDLYNLLEVLYRHDTKEWAQLNKNGGKILTDDSISSIDVKVNITGSGRSSLEGMGNSPDK